MRYNADKSNCCNPASTCGGVYFLLFWDLFVCFKLRLWKAVRVYLDVQMPFRS